jgi:glutaredoxin 3
MPNIKIYTTPGCPYCKNAKDFLNNQNLSFTEIDVSEDDKAAQEMFSKSRQMGVPQIWIDSSLIVGFDKAKLKEKLGMS